MYLDHRVIAKIARMLSRVKMNVMLLDNNGQVILPEDNHREFTLPEAIRRNRWCTAGLPSSALRALSPCFWCWRGIPRR